MAHPNMATLRRICLDAVQRVADRPALDVEVALAPDSSNRPAYSVTFLFEQDRDRARAALMRTRIAQKIRDDLIAAGDARYPYVRFVSRADWSDRERARSA